VAVHFSNASYLDHRLSCYRVYYVKATQFLLAVWLELFLKPTYCDVAYPVSLVLATDEHLYYRPSQFIMLFV
jgi:hypothetical protein